MPAARVREAFALPGTSAETEAAVTDKFRTRSAAAARRRTHRGGLPGDVPARPARGARVGGSPGRGEARGLHRQPRRPAHRRPSDADALRDFYDADAAAESGRDRLIVESVIPGDEISAEAV
ncbi:hypothetical protein LT493_43860 [Streptomyces tricolor]|nr:hypothetical protein [Streptomyces tricolor]